MNNKLVKSYGLRTDKSMKTVVRLGRADLKINNLTITYLSKHNLTVAQFRVLEVLYHLGDLNISTITKLTMSTAGNITVVVKNLKRDELVTSIKDPKDSRASILSISKKGVEIIEEVFPGHAENLFKALEVLNDVELDTLYELLDKVYKAN